MLKFKVSIKADFVTTVQVYGFSAPNETVNIENLKLNTFLTNLSCKCVCKGVISEPLQEFSALPRNDQNQLYFRHVICRSVGTHTSTVRSKCCVLLTENGQICEPCQYVERLLRMKEKRAIASKSSCIKTNHSLNLPREKLMRWHPMMIRLAILLHSRSPAAYDTLRKTGVLQLPGESTLQDYTNVFQPSPGFSRHILPR